MVEGAWSGGFAVEFLARRPEELAQWWARALGWDVLSGSAGTLVVAPSDEVGLPLVFVGSEQRKSGKNSVHLDLPSATHVEQRTKVEQLFNAGAHFADIGQADVPWVVMSDPEGNEFCVLEPRKTYTATGSLAAAVVDCEAPDEHARAWAETTGMAMAHSGPELAGLRPPDGRGPWLEFLHDRTNPDSTVRLISDVR
jgi:hypothetical protein